MAFDRVKTLQVAQKYIEKRKYDRAIGEYQKVVQHDPNDARTLLRIGDLQSRQEAFAEAISSYDRVARFYAGRGFSLKAIAVLKQIREMIDKHAPHLADQYSHVSPKLAQIYADLGLVTDALATYEGAARRLQSAGRERDVVDILRRMLALDRSNPLPYLRLAEALCRVGRLDEAIEHFWSAAQQLTQLERAEDALKVIERILHFRQDVRVCRVAAELYLARGTREAALLALSRLQACFDADPKDLETLTLLAKAFELLEQSSKSVEVYKELVRLATDTDRLELRDEYLAHLQKVVPQDPEVQAFVRQASSPTESQPVGSTPRVDDVLAVGPVDLGPESLPLDDIEFLDDDDAVEALDVDEPETAVRAGLSERAVFNRGLSNFAVSEGVPSVVDPQSPTAPAPQKSPVALSEEDLEEFARQSLVDAESFRGLGLYDRAFEALNNAVAQGHDSVEMRQALRKVLQESGDLAGAREQMLATARLHRAAGDPRAAVAELGRIIEKHPGHEAAIALLRELGGEAEQGPGSSVDSAMRQTGEHEAFELRPRVVQSEAPSSIARPPLPSYSLEIEDIEVEDITSVPPSELEGGESEMSLAVTQVPPPRSGQLQAPVPVVVAADPPLPQFTLEELHVSPGPPSVAELNVSSNSIGAPIPLSRPISVLGDSVLGDLGTSTVPLSGPPSFADDSLAVFPGVPSIRAPLSRGALPAPALEEVLPGSPPPSRRAQGVEAHSLVPKADKAARRESIRAALDEVEFFSSRGLYQDASMILRDRLEQYPGEPGLVDALAALEAQLAVEREQRQAAVAPGAASQANSVVGVSSGGLQARFTTDGTVEGGPVLDVEDELELVASLEQAPAMEVDIDEVFAKFKEGVKDQIEESDSATHYDLGVAYKEMGLLADAGQEFEIASRDPKRECNSLGMMGMMYRQSGDLELAAEAYVRALNAGHKSLSQEVSLYYELGCIYQQKQDAEEAVYYFERITRRETNYRDVARRMAELAALLPSPSSPPPALSQP